MKKILKNSNPNIPSSTLIGTIQSSIIKSLSVKDSTLEIVFHDGSILEIDNYIDGSFAIEFKQ